MRFSLYLNEIKGFTTKSDIPDYIEMQNDPEYFEKKKHKKFEIVYMKPDEYIKKVVSGFKSDFPKYSTSQLRSDCMQDTIKKYANDMKNGDKFPILILDYTRSSGFSQEGRHRACAAELAGIKTIPVMVVTKI